MHLKNIKSFKELNETFCFVNIIGMEPERRKTKKYTFKSLEVEELRNLGSLIVDQDKFYSKYGILLYLLGTNMEEGILSTLTHFYDSLYHCFTFPDYQLFPTLKEYSSIIGLPADLLIEKALTL